MHPPAVDDEDADERQKFQDEAAFASHVRALHAAQRRGDLRAQAAALTNLGLLYTAYGQVDDALRVYRAAYARYRRVSDTPACARVLIHVAHMWREVENLTQALAVQQKALICYHDLGDRRGQAEAFIGLGHVYAAMGNMGHALEALHAALHHYACLKDRRQQAEVHVGLSMLLRHCGTHEEVLHQLLRAQALSCDLSASVEGSREETSSEPVIRRGSPRHQATPGR